MTKPTQRYAYAPDHATPPGDLIQEHLDHFGISARELARRCGRSGKLIAEITAGKAPVEPETALQLERVLGVSAQIWSNMQAAFQLHQARVAEDEALAQCYEWASGFPIKELANRGYMSSVSGKATQVKEVLQFFGVGSVKACEDRIDELLDVDYRTSPSFNNDKLSLASWLRIGEREAAILKTEDYDREAFLEVLGDIRELTRLPIDKALPKAKAKCAEAGVAFVVEEATANVRASGVSRWLSPRKALIQQTLRHKCGDHFWFTFYHECAHLLLHSRKSIFIDMPKGKGVGSADPKQEAEADAWAADFLVPGGKMKKFLATFGGSSAEVKAFAATCRIAPGIVVGQLQHLKVIPYASKLNSLKEWFPEDVVKRIG